MVFSSLLSSSSSSLDRSGSSTTTPNVVVVDDKALLHIASFLSGQDALHLQCLSKDLYDFVKNHDDEIFGKLLITEFPEGGLVAEVFSSTRRHRRHRSSTTYDTDSTSSSSSTSSTPSFRFTKKQMYLAFCNRYKVGKKKEGVKGGSSHIAMPWQPSDTATTIDDITNALEFIIRVWDCPESCGLLGWERNNKRREDQLTMDEEWYEDKVLDFPPLKDEICKLIDDELNDNDDDDDSEDNQNDERSSKRMHKILENWKSTYRLSLHVVDVETCQVLTLLEESKAIGGWNWCNGQIVPVVLYGHAADEMPTFYGLPYRGSPYWQNYKDTNELDRGPYEIDFNTSTRYQKLESLQFVSALNLGRSLENYYRAGKQSIYDDGVYMDKVEISANPDNSTIRSRHAICSYLRALMKEKCCRPHASSSGGAILPDAAGFPPNTIQVVENPNPHHQVQQEQPDASLQSQQQQQQPVWVDENEKPSEILQHILSYASFEDQATKLRLVCKSFKMESLRFLENKLLNIQWLPIAFTRYDAGSWFRADARRGWSSSTDTEEEDDASSMTTKDHVIDTALWMVSCRCVDSNCRKSKEGGCPGTTKKEAPSFRVDGVTKQLDMVEARRLLMEHGKFQLTSNGPQPVLGWISSRRPVVEASFQQQPAGETNLYQVCQQVHKSIKKEVDYDLLPSNLRNCYGVSCPRMSSKRFLRSLFLVFTDGTTSLMDGHYPEVTVAVASAQPITEKGIIYCRMKKIFRFETAQHEKVEICLESKHYIY